MGAVGVSVASFPGATGGIAALRRFAREPLHKITTKPFTSPTAGHSQRPVISQQQLLRRFQAVPNSAAWRHKYSHDDDPLGVVVSGLRVRVRAGVAAPPAGDAWG